MKDGHVGRRNNKFGQRCGRQTSSKENRISKIKDNNARSYTPRFLLYVSDKKNFKELIYYFFISVQNFQNCPIPMDYPNLKFRKQNFIVSHSRRIFGCEHG
jgi:hypothetical protein